MLQFGKMIAMAVIVKLSFRAQREIFPAPRSGAKSN
jgi:hypothetical protein